MSKLLRVSQFDIKQPSLFFDQWAQDKVIKDLNDEPQVLYHGTTHAFDTFDLQKAFPYSYWGKAFYFSNNPQDSSLNYTGEGSDLKNNIETLKDRYFNEFDYMDDKQIQEIYEKYKNQYPEWFEVKENTDEIELENNLTPEQKNHDDDEIKIKEEHLDDLFELMATDELHGQRPNVIPVYVKMNNPLFLTHYNEPTMFVYDFDEDEDGEFSESGNFLKLIDAIKDTGYEFGYDGEQLYEDFSSELWSELEENNYQISAVKVNEILRNGNIEIYDDYGDAGSFAAEVFKNMGYDGIIMDAHKYFGNMPGVNENTQHYIVWNNKNIKSALGNTGVYDVNNPSITAFTHKTKKIAETLKKISNHLDTKQKFAQADLVTQALKKLAHKKDFN